MIHYINNKIIEQAYINVINHRITKLSTSIPEPKITPPSK
jgi:hypothetical protein